MKIGIDARLIGQSGVGRYIRNLILWLGDVDSENSYVLFLPPNTPDRVNLPNSRWSKRTVNAPWHSIREQLVLPSIFTQEHLDILHVPYFTIPIFYPGTMVVTVHDLTILHIHTGKATLLPRPLYELKRIGYWIILRVGLSRAKKILAVSQATKQEIVNHFGIRPDKIVVTPEGIDAAFLEKSRHKTARTAPDRYILYVGNAYPHKNLEYLLEAFTQFQKVYETQRDVKLLLVGRSDPFYKRFMTQVQKRQLSNDITFVGEVSDAQLVDLYRNAQVLVFPSLMEGFGLPALESIACGTPVIVSDIPVFHEILGEAAVYINPRDPRTLVDKLNDVLGHRSTYVKGLSRVAETLGREYSWEHTARLTLAAYTACFPLSA